MQTVRHRNSTEKIVSYFSAWGWRGFSQWARAEMEKFQQFHTTYKNALSSVGERVPCCCDTRPRPQQEDLLVLSLQGCSSARLAQCRKDTLGSVAQQWRGRPRAEELGEGAALSRLVALTGEGAVTQHSRRQPTPGKQWSNSFYSQKGRQKTRAET